MLRSNSAVAGWAAARAAQVRIVTLAKMTTSDAMLSRQARPQPTSGSTATPAAQRSSVREAGICAATAPVVEVSVWCCSNCSSRVRSSWCSRWSLALLDWTRSSLPASWKVLAPCPACGESGASACCRPDGRLGVPDALRHLAEGVADAAGALDAMRFRAAAAVRRRSAAVVRRARGAPCVLMPAALPGAAVVNDADVKIAPAAAAPSDEAGAALGGSIRSFFLCLLSPASGALKYVTEPETRIADGRK